MNNCTCGKDVRLRACKITVNRHRGITNWIEHMDGTRVCPPGEWSSAEMKPYQTPRQSAALVDRWNHIANSVNHMTSQEAIKPTLPTTIKIQGSWRDA